MWSLLHVLIFSLLSLSNEIFTILAFNLLFYAILIISLFYFCFIDKSYDFTGALLQGEINRREFSTPAENVYALSYTWLHGLFHVFTSSYVPDCLALPILPRLYLRIYIIVTGNLYYDY